MEKITYNDLVERYGRVMAFDLLLLVERLAKIRDDIATFDEETRFQRAVEALNEVDFAA
jgi:hypothetical protein